jgi:clan AA aspartic protease
MGNVFAEILLKNSTDVTNVGRGIISEENVRSVSVTALVDTGAMTLIINEDMCQKLGLSILSTRTVSLAGGQESVCKITEPVRIIWKDRDTDCRAWVLPGEDEALLGVIPLEDMDLVVDPKRRELIGAHGDIMMGRIK